MSRRTNRTLTATDRRHLEAAETGQAEEIAGAAEIADAVDVPVAVVADVVAAAADGAEAAVDVMVADTVAMAAEAEGTKSLATDCQILEKKKKGRTKSAVLFYCQNGGFPRAGSFSVFEQEMPAWTVGEGSGRRIPAYRFPCSWRKNIPDSHGR